MDLKKIECKKNLKRVLPYIHGELDNAETKEFLEHIRQCPSCKEELDLYFAIEIGLKETQQRTGLSISDALRERIEASYRRLRAVRTAKIMYYALNTLVITGLIIMLLLQLRIWNIGFGGR